MNETTTLEYRRDENGFIVPVQQRPLEELIAELRKPWPSAKDAKAPEFYYCGACGAECSSLDALIRHEGGCRFISPVFAPAGVR